MNYRGFRVYDPADVMWTLIQASPEGGVIMRRYGVVTDEQLPVGARPKARQTIVVVIRITVFPADAPGEPQA